MINYEVSCGVLNGGGSPYAHPSLEKNEKVGITEMWAHAVGYIMLYEYLGNKMYAYPVTDKYWFKPTVVWNMYKAGLSLKDISDSMSDTIITLQAFKEQLIEDNEQYKATINSIFSTYLSM